MDLEAAASDRCPRQRAADVVGDRFLDVHEREAVVDLDRPDDAPRDAGLVRDRSDQVAGPDTRTPAATDEEADPWSARARSVHARSTAVIWTEPATLAVDWGADSPRAGSWAVAGRWAVPSRRTPTGRWTLPRSGALPGSRAVTGPGTPVRARPLVTARRSAT